MRIELPDCTLRSWQESDAESLTEHANCREVWLNLRDAFPHPYRHADAVAYIRGVRASQPETSLAIEIDGEAAGSIGFRIGVDIERVSAEIGYWLGKRHWGRGIVTSALVAARDAWIAEHGLTRLFALPFASNDASCRVLEKAGFELEGRLRRSAIKDGRIIDQLQYAFVVDASTEGCNETTT